ncbi:MAG TPA: hypothetical protein VNL16_02995 [Chloroflexota bacterium]|nr:hypothetical protein [Chloroflexota bacterium]
MKREETGGVNWALIVAGGIVLVAAAAVAIQFVPELAPVRRSAHEAEDLAKHLPDRTRGALQGLRARLDRARAAFQKAKIESERALTAQFEEAKQRGSVPPT